MSLEKDLAFFIPEHNTALTIGVFDGVHLGHQSLLAELVKQAKHKGLTSGVITFKQHPRMVINPSNEILFLTNLSLKIQLIKNTGIQFVVPLTFTPEIAKISTRQFIELLQKHLKMQELVVGPDFALGRNREGDINTLCTLRQDMNFDLKVVPVIKINNDVISSTGIRNALSVGDMKKVHNQLGRHFSLEGQVITGTGTGKILGFPTANLDVDPQQALPLEGVYATQILFDNEYHQSVTFIGNRSTFGDNRRTIETHVIDYHSDLYHKILKIDIIYRLRNVIKFNCADDLSKKIKEDIVNAREILNRLDRD
ncbi:MAG: bifunctional riboflavin kinase/FAD synthetase [Dehalococcoidales bacterium]|nr:bifunctional riboflavin kinase/FAD synthetase [Dehalococcoidales bacterium]